MVMGKKAAAFFDVDGTILRATIVHYYVYFATQGRSAFRRGVFWVWFIPQILSFLILDKISRSAFNRVFYRRYRGMEAARLRGMAQGLLDGEMRARLFPDAVARVERHRAAGERIVLVTGSLDFIVEPLARMLGAEEVIAARMEERDGLLAGELAGPPIGDEEKARLVRAYAEAHGIELTESFAYGDSSSDLPMLRCAGHPVAVNPGKRLRKAAEKDGWEIVEWKTALTPAH